MKIFIGCFDIASILTGVAEGLRGLGNDVTTFVLERNKFYPDISYDVVKEPYLKSKFDYQRRELPVLAKKFVQKVDDYFYKLNRQYITNELIHDHDLFIFIWSPWLPEEQLFKKIKKANKKIICLHVGSDVRHISAYRQEFNEDVSLWEQYFHEEDLNKKIRKIRYHELFADVIFSVPDQEGLAIRGYNHLHIPLRNLDLIDFCIPGRRIPVIIHAPSKSGIKGTSIIIETIERLKKEGYAFEFRLLKDLSNEDLKKQLSDADILLDELLLHGPGVLSFEAMAAGCLVLTRTINRYKDIFNPPVISVTPFDVYDKLKSVLSARDTSFIHEGRKYVMKHNNPIKVAQNIINSLSKESTDYQPVFFLNKYSYPPNFKLDIRNEELTRLVKQRFYSTIDF